MTQTAARTSTVSSLPDAYVKLCALSREASMLGSVDALLQWDQETYMPPGAAEARAEQLALMSALVHERRTSPRIGDLLAACESDSSLKADAEAAANLREFRRDFDRLTKIPQDLVAELARVGSQAQQAWKQARANSDFPAFAPWLKRMIGLARRKAECLGAPPGGELYDALLDEYEPGARAADIEAVFTPLASRLSSLIADLTTKGKAPADAPLKIDVDPARQHAFGQTILSAIGFDLSIGRLDTTTHPFCSGLSPGDTRLTTRYTESSFVDALYSSLHEAGHGIYEQGLPKLPPRGLFGQPLAEAISLGIHESQSRMWENFVGRSREFWVWALPIARQHLGPAIHPFSAEDLYRAVNIVRPSYIRVEADEATYNLHVMLRFEIERALISGSLGVDELPARWNARFKQLLGIDVPDNRRGCLQDVHWSFGLIGYFPTYTLGNLYAAQLWETIHQQIPDLPGHMARGEFGPLKSWLNTNIHAHGRLYRAAELCAKLTGKPLSADPLMRHLTTKLLAVYSL